MSGPFHINGEAESNQPLVEQTGPLNKCQVPQ